MNKNKRNNVQHTKCKTCSDTKIVIDVEQSKYPPFPTYYGEPTQSTFYKHCPDCCEASEYKNCTCFICCPRKWAANSVILSQESQELEKLKEENEKLKSENKELSWKVENQKKEITTFINKYRTEHGIRLQMEGYFRNTIKNLEEINKNLTGKNDELNQENEKLKAENAKLSDTICEMTASNLAPAYPHVYDSNCECDKCSLTFEKIDNDNLRKENQEIRISAFKSEAALTQEIEKLKAELQNRDKSSQVEHCEVSGVKLDSSYPKTQQFKITPAPYKPWEYEPWRNQAK